MDGSIPDSKNFLEGFALCLRQAGIDVTRITTGVPILHPQISSFSGLWQLGKGTSERLCADARQPGVLENSPIKIAYGGKLSIDRHAGFPILEDLRRDGITDYIVLPVPAMTGKDREHGVANELENFAIVGIDGIAAAIDSFSRVTAPLRSTAMSCSAPSKCLVNASSALSALYSGRWGLNDSSVACRSPLTASFSSTCSKSGGLRSK
jgi:hypothetical protein